MSATVTGTVLTVVGWKKRPLAANATTTSAAAATAATNANFSGRLVGPSIGSRKPKAGCDFRSLITCSKARPTSTRASGTASSVGVERVVAFLQRLRRLALLPASGPSQAVEGGMGGGPMQPCRRVFRRRRVETVEIDEDFLGHVLRLMRIGEDAIRYPDDAAVFGC